VTSSTSNGNYKVDDVIVVSVNFSEEVTLSSGGRLVLTLETGETDRTVTVFGPFTGTSGSGTYTVQSTDTSSDLDYKATSSLALTVGTLRDGAANDATLTLAAPGASGSLANTSALVIDTTAATVTSVTSSTTNGSYKAGQAVSIQVVFNEVMTVTGTPQIELETGDTDRQATYASGDGSNTLTFTYTVQATDTSSDLDYKATTSLALNGGTINDPAGNAATLTLATPGAANSLGNNNALVIDSSAATVTNVTSSTVNATKIFGQSVSFDVVLCVVMTVSGTPLVSLECGSSVGAVVFGCGWYC
jgi:phage tail sheath protein FI